MSYAIGCAGLAWNLLEGVERQVQRLVMVAVFFGLAVAVAVPGMAAGYVSFGAVERQIQERERYLQVVNYQAPGFVLEDAAGRTVSLADFKGRVVVLNFIYARCREACPLHSALLASVQKQINRMRLQDQVQFVSIATDTEDTQETAALLRAYGARYGLDPVNWRFLYRGGGAPHAALMLAEQYGLKFMPMGDNGQMHGVVTHVIDQDGVLRARFHGLRFNPTNLILYISALVHEGTHADSGAGMQQGGITAQWSSPMQTGSAAWWWLGLGLAGLGVAVVCLSRVGVDVVRRLRARRPGRGGGP